MVFRSVAANVKSLVALALWSRDTEPLSGRGGSCPIGETKEKERCLAGIEKRDRLSSPLGCLASNESKDFVLL